MTRDNLKNNALLVSAEVIPIGRAVKADSSSQIDPLKSDIYTESTCFMTESKANMSDQQLVKLVQRGDKTAFDMLVIKYQHRVASVVSRYIQDFQEVSDVTQEAFIKAYRAIDRFRGDSAFYTWIYRIAINTAKNSLVAKGRRPPSSDVELDDSEHLISVDALENIDTPDALLQKSEMEALVHKTLASLPEELRVALTLREFDGMSYDEISQVMGCPVGTVRSRIFRAREAIDEVIAPLMKQNP